MTSEIKRSAAPDAYAFGLSVAAWNDDERVGFPLIRKVGFVARIAIGLVIGAALLALAGRLGTESMPAFVGIPGGTGASTATFGAILLLAIALGLHRPGQRVGRPATFLFALVLVHGVFSLAAIGPDMVGRAEWALANPPWEQSWQIAASLALIALGQILHRSARGHGVLVAGAAVFLPLVAFLSCHCAPLQLMEPDSQLAMSMLLLLSLAGLMRYAARPELRPLFGDNEVGRLARLQLAAGLFAPWLVAQIGYFATGSRMAPETPVLLATLMGLAMLFVTVSAHRYDALERRRRRTERALLRFSVTDRLTGAMNRFGARILMEQLPRNVFSAVVLVDIDHFKRINDHHGHAEGDRILSEIVRAMRPILREPDLLIRWGGEEFLMVLPGAGIDEAAAIAERLRASLATITGPSGRRGEITLCAGVAVQKMDEEGLEAATARADAALYRAKAAGRNRVARDDGFMAPRASQAIRDSDDPAGRHDPALSLPLRESA